MSEDDIAKLIETNQRLLIIIGYSIGCIKKPKKNDKDGLVKYEWLMRAIENVIYLDRPLPKMP